MSEGSLKLWKRDLTRTLRWNLCRFVEELINDPNQYFQEENGATSPVLGESDVQSDTESWDTDFEVDEPPESSGGDSLRNEDSDDCSPEMYTNGNSPLQSRASPGKISVNKTSRSTEEDSEDDNIYENGAQIGRSISSPNNPVTSHGANIVAQLQEQLRRKQMESSRNVKPALGPKPKIIGKHFGVQQFVRANQTPGKLDSEKTTQSPESDQNIRAPRIIISNKHPVFPPKPIPKPISKPTAKPIPKPKEAPPVPTLSDKKLTNFPKPPSSPVRIGKLDLVADLPPEKGDDSDEYFYEPIEEQSPVKRHLSVESVRSVHSTQSLALSARSIRGSNESVDHRRSMGSVEENQDGDFYESIPEKRDDRDEYVRPLCNPPRMFTSLPRPLPSTPSPTSSLQKRPEKPKAGTFPHKKQSSDTVRGTRPLPPPPNIPRPERPIEPPDRNVDVPSYADRPWFHNVKRDEAIALIEGAPTKSDGYFLVRPSNANAHQPWTLVLWYRDRTFNIAIRERPDTRYALGKVKPKEQSFANIEEMVNFYKKEELVLNSATGGTQDGSTRLTETPPKRNG